MTRFYRLGGHRPVLRLNFAILFCHHSHSTIVFPTEYTFTIDYDLQKDNYFLWAKCFPKTSYHLQEKEQNASEVPSNSAPHWHPLGAPGLAPHAVARKKWNRRRHHWGWAAGNTAGTSPSCWEITCCKERIGGRGGDQDGLGEGLGTLRAVGRSPWGASPKGLNRVLSPCPEAEAELVKLGLC